uniref:Uncharacterized protein n=1 Tax=Arundo donax TaxID=35708 RepID=A0A0A9AKI3_ARUDO
MHRWHVNPNHSTHARTLLFSSPNICKPHYYFARRPQKPLIWAAISPEFTSCGVCFWLPSRPRTLRLLSSQSFCARSVSALAFVPAPSTGAYRPVSPSVLCTFRPRRSLPILIRLSMFSFFASIMDPALSSR